MNTIDERRIITELIELYRNLPCLWDTSCEDYKNIKQKSAAWEILTEKLKTIEPDANFVSAKKKIENLRTSYKRAAKKVKDSKKLTGSASNEVYKPNLWYFDLLSFIDHKDCHLQRGVDTLSSDESQQSEQRAHQNLKRRGSQEHPSIEKKRHKFIDKGQTLESSPKRSNSFGVYKHKPQTLPESSPKRTNSFGAYKHKPHSLLESSPKTNSFVVYVGEQLDSMSTSQRQVAEKLISDVIFLGKTGNLNFDSRVETSSKKQTAPLYQNQSFQYNYHSPHISPSSPTDPLTIDSSYKSPETITASSFSSPRIKSPIPSPPPECNVQDGDEDSLLKQLLIDKTQ